MLQQGRAWKVMEDLEAMLRGPAIIGEDTTVGE
jgi:hypothetical protein